MTLVVWWLLLLSTAEGSSNLALGKTAEQSGTSGSAAAARAVDGNADTSLAGGSCSITAVGRMSWWSVDLGCEYRVNRVRITSSVDGSPLRKLYVEVTRTDFSGKEFLYKEDPVPGGGVLDIVRPEGVRGRFVHIDMDLTYAENLTSDLTLCEVEVYGSREQYFKLDARRGANNKILHQTTRTNLECAQTCLGKDICRSFLWNPTNGECVLYSDTPTLDVPPDNVLGFVEV